MDGIDDIDDNIPDSDVQDLGPDYSKIQRHGQLWRCQPGDTSTMLPFNPFSTVCEPGHTIMTTENILKLLPTSRETHSTHSLDLTAKVRHDPFRNLHYDAILTIMPYLSGEDRLNLMNASHYVYTITQNPSFWKVMMKAQFLSYFPELGPVIAHPDFGPPAFNVKQVYFYLDHATEPEFSMQGPFMGIANRKQILNAIHPLVSIYQLEVHPSDNEEEGSQVDNEEDKNEGEDEDEGRGTEVV